MNLNEKFQNGKLINIEKMGGDQSLSELGVRFAGDTAKYNYSYNF